MAEKDQLAVSYAAFILSGQGADVTSDSLNAVLSGSGSLSKLGPSSLTLTALNTFTGNKVSQFCQQRWDWPKAQKIKIFLACRIFSCLSTLMKSLGTLVDQLYTTTRTWAMHVLISASTSCAAS